MAFTIFGQFLDHDLDLTESGQDEPMNIKIPDNDNFFTERNFLPFRRSKFINGTTSRDHVNFITAWIDGSQIYGSDEITNR